MRKCTPSFGVVLCLLLAVPSGTAAGEEGAASIEALSARLETVTDLLSLVPLVHPDDRAYMGMLMALFGGFAAASAEDPEAATAKYQALLARHGLDELLEDDAGPGPQGPEEQRTKARQVMKDVDIVALLTDLTAFGDEHRRNEQQGGMPVPSGRFEDLQVDGDSATAMLDGQPVNLARVGGRWYLRFDPL